MAAAPLVALSWLVLVLLLVEGVRGLTWCVARSDASQQALQKAIDYACGVGGADCSPIQPTGLCYLPNTLLAHASYAFNSYYQRRSMAPGSCDFAGTATVAASDPSYGSCVYPSSLSTAGGPASTTPTSSTPTTTIPTIIPSPPAVFITPPTYDSGTPSSGATRSHGVYLFPLMIMIIRYSLPAIV
ncbi:hypothetical protein MLD38_018170 [Melastoma candidum]|uniref:Uncharacterized protein n=1 Tax=Melastoma candidum TaxID=119954 RepID=A0ACB9QT12_9MYRT|nr:hypothetical protein MLD38_018170 [Melastoma candidum]